MVERRAMVGQRVLVVDDEQDMVDSLARVIRKCGHSVKCETDPLNAIDLALSGEFDIMLLDYKMYPINGDEVVKRLRDNGCDIYIILLTGYSESIPPLQTLEELDIQVYWEKSTDNFQVVLLLTAGLKAVNLARVNSKFKDGLKSILQAVPKIYQLQPIDIILEEVLKEIMPLVSSEDAFILVDDLTGSTDSEKSIFSGIGKYSCDIESFISLLDPLLLERIGYSRTSKTVVELKNGIILPLISEYKQSMGVMYVESDNFDEGGRTLLELYANQAASSLNNAFLHSLVNMQKEELNKTHEELVLRYRGTVEALRRAVDAKDAYTLGHSERVAELSVQIGKEMGLAKNELDILFEAGMFHDIGKIGTADDILLKNTKLTNDEYNEIKRHPLIGVHILSAVAMFKKVIPLVGAHHERPDGNGYPNKLKGDEIPFLARVLAVADAYDAMTSDRQYRVRQNIEYVKGEIIKGSGTQFDSEVVNVFLDMLDKGKVTIGLDKEVMLHGAKGDES